MGPVGCSWLSLLIDQCRCCVKGKLLYSQSITALMINKVIGEILEHRPTDKNSSTGTSTGDLPDHQRYEKLQFNNENEHMVPPTVVKD